MRNKRLELGLLQKDVAAIFGTSEDTITNWENNKSLLQIRYYPKLISFLEYFPFPIDLGTFGGSLKYYRIYNGLSLKRMGKLFGVDSSIIANWENDLNEPKKANIYMLKKLYHNLKKIT